MAKPAEASNVGIAETKEFKDQAESKASEPDAGEYNDKNKKAGARTSTLINADITKK